MASSTAISPTTCRDAVTACLLHLLLVLLWLPLCSQALSSPKHTPVDRRSVLSSSCTIILGSSVAVVGLVAPSSSHAVSSSPGMTIQGSGGSYTRVEGMGGGFDIRTSSPTTTKQSGDEDVIYPSSMAGLWKCRRVVTSVEGDAGQAELAWKTLGGTGSSFKSSIESFDTRFVLPPDKNTNSYSFDGQTLKGVVLDRGSEMASRTDSAAVTWSVDAPDTLFYTRRQGGEPSEVEISVVQRKLELPTEQGFGFNELYRVTSSAGGILFADQNVQRAVRVQRRYRRAFDENGNRIVEGLEIMKTYRVLDGIAGIEMPTSTTKSSLKFRMAT